MSVLVVGEKSYQKRVYNPREVISFAKVDASYGGLHNMAPNYPIMVNGVEVRTSEHLYQALAFPYNMAIQESILKTKSPMTAKMVMKECIQYKRGDWDQVKIPIMKWCLTMKIINNWSTFGVLLKSTGDKTLVEYSRKDEFWGAMKQGYSYVGVNALGRLLMGLREEMNTMQGAIYRLDSPPVQDLLFLDKRIQSVEIELPLLP